MDTGATQARPAPSRIPSSQCLTVGFQFPSDGCSESPGPPWLERFICSHSLSFFFFFWRRKQKVCPVSKCSKPGTLERWRLSQRMRAQFPALTWQVTTTCNSVPGDPTSSHATPDTRRTHGGHMYVQAKHLYTSHKISLTALSCPGLSERTIP